MEAAKMVREHSDPWDWIKQAVPEYISQDLRNLKALSVAAVRRVAGRERNGEPMNLS